MLTDEQMIELETLSRPLVKWMNDNCNPHVECNINQHRVELLEGTTCILIPDYLKD